MVTRELFHLTTAEAHHRASRIKLVLSDCDGVLTDNGVYYGETGELFKRFSIRDGMGVERLRNAGIQTAIISGERSPSIRARAQKLGITALYTGVKDKAARLSGIASETGLSQEEIAFIGDDVNDLALVQALMSRSLTGAPADAMPALRVAVHYRSSVMGGHGAFRDFAELVLELRG